ncbi:MAG TPA: thiol:disulfide interchange protein, partial [Deltaproteobacteria bacterium]|nr:thiol:disulfide interchange protein [Deltaproteobacteria bacterium]
MNGDTLAKILLVLITLCFATVASAAEKVPFGSEPLAPEEAFVMDHIIVG